MMKAAQVRWLQAGSKCPDYIYATFKQQSIQKDIMAMQDAQGNIHKDWDKIADTVIEHFVMLLGTKVPPDEAALVEVLAT